MGLESLKSLPLILPYLPSSCKTAFHARSCFECRNTQLLTYRLVHRSTLFGFCSNLKNFGLKISCGANLDEYFEDEIVKLVEDLAQNFDTMDDDEDYNNDTPYAVSDISRCDDEKTSENVDSSVSFTPSKLEFLEPSLLGIQPEPPEWPEREAIARISIELRANSVDIPLSLRMIKRKQKWQKRFVDAGDFAHCSVKKVFSSMVLIIRELQSHALYIRESLCCENLEGVIRKVRMEMNASFVWLFQQVFPRTPTLMVYVMLLLANFTVNSVASEFVAPVSPSPKVYCETITATPDEVPQEQSKVDQNRGSDNVGAAESDQICSGNEDWHGNQEMTQEEEMALWKSMAAEASRMQAQSRYKAVDHDTMQRLVSSVHVELEPDDYEEYHRTDLIYQMSIAEDPNNPLLLSNYAQFLFLVTRDYDRAEECFKRAVMVEPPDAEALTRYADFLWIVRKDLWNAEETYQQAMTAGSSNYHASKYATFLWRTGGEETCFPLNSLR